MSDFINASRGLGGMGIENDTYILRLEKAIARLERTFWSTGTAFGATRFE
jgi:hypothetical protein